MLQRINAAFVLALFGLLAAGRPASAQLFFDDFESYNLGSLDKNDPNGPNQAPNGSGNPWFGPEINSPNAWVVGSENGVDPISGSQMIRGRAANDFDQNWFNLAYRLNGGLPFMENVVFSWWFYDPLGPGGTDFRDYAALTFYDTVPPDTDAPDNYNLSRGANKIQRLSLGATFHTDTGYDSNYYQARVVNATDGYNGAGWFNTTTPRSVGWHQGLIMIGPMHDDGTNDVFFFIDDLTNPTFMHNSMTNWGYNALEINTNYGAQTGYFDDVSFDSM
jgi:hypothetical protein